MTYYCIGGLRAQFKSGKTPDQPALAASASFAAGHPHLCLLLLLL